MSKIELLLLGMLIEKPQSAYDLHKDIEYHQLSRWTNISTASVYKKVLSLSEQGFLTGRAVPGSRLSGKVVYEVTERGRNYFEQLMKAYAKQCVTFCLDINVVVANLGKLGQTAALEILGDLEHTVQQSSQRHEGYLAEYEGAGLPFLARAILEQQKQLHDTLSTWMDTFAGQFREECHDEQCADRAF